jgi:uncharacterized damage-inducible protein DinB
VADQRRGPIGALLDEHERAARELARLLAALSDEQYLALRGAQTADARCRSIQTVMTHVVGAGHGYAGMMRAALGLPAVPHARVDVSRAESLARLELMLAHLDASLAAHGGLSEEECAAIRMRASWGVDYDLEQLFEHAVVHLLRHRRQIERWLAAERL